MTTVISVRFRNGCKTYYFDPGNLVIGEGQNVIVETAQGAEFALCTQGNHPVPDDAVVQPLRTVLRIATDNDRHTAAYNRSRENEAFDICEKKIAQHGLEMKLVRAECSFDGSKILFFFTADGRVDFRGLVKDLAAVFRSRIELRQIGVRDEAKMLGGLGICGRPFCCSQFLDEFMPVSIKMAKTQNLSLNPTKISGTCGRLMCCLKYEQDAYEDAVKRMPKAESFVLTPDGPGNVSDVNLLKETVTVHLDNRTDAPRCYHNCEICVLRNGKGSRDGIEVPARWPERYSAPVETPAPAATAEEVSEWPETGIRGQEDRTQRRKSRSSKSRREALVENRPADNQETREHDESRESREGRANRSRRKVRGGHGGNRRPADRPANEAAAPQSAAAPQQDSAVRSSGEGNNRHRHYNRRRSGRGGSKSGNQEG